MSSHKPRATQPPLLSLVAALLVPTMERRTCDLLHTLPAAGITATDVQVQALIEHGMSGLGGWIPSRVLRDLAPAASQHFSIARRAQPAVAQPNVRDIRKETT